MEFPPFDLLHWFEETHEGYLHLSKSEMLGFRFSEFGREVPDLDLGEAFPRGSPELRSMLGAQHRTWPDSVLVCNGASEANFLVHAALVSPRDEAIVEVPLYPPLRDAMVGLGANVTRVPRLSQEGWRLDLDALEAAVTDRTRLVVLANLNNPTGVAVADADLRRLAEVAEAHDFYVHVDETFRELAFDEAPVTAVALGPRFVVTSTMTKVYGLGGLRLGWVVASQDLIQKIKGVKDYASICPSRLSEELAMWALERKGGFLGRAKRIIEENRAIVRAWLERNPEVEGILPNTGNVCFPKMPVSVDRLAERLRKHYKVVIAPGRFFGLNGHFRLGYGGRRSDLEKGLSLVDTAMAGLARTEAAKD